MKISFLPFVLLISCMSVVVPGTVHAVNSFRTESDTTEREAVVEKKMDGLSLAAYISAALGVASFFIVAPLTILLLPAAFVMGMIALLSGRRRYVNRRGRGLALAAMILGGTFTLFLFASFIAFGLFGF